MFQGILLSALFPMLKPTGSSLHRGIKFALIVGAFFWTSHVLAFVAKQEVQYRRSSGWNRSIFFSSLVCSD